MNQLPIDIIRSLEPYFENPLILSKGVQLNYFKTMLKKLSKNKIDKLHCVILDPILNKPYEAIVTYDNSCLVFIINYCAWNPSDTIGLFEDNLIKRGRLFTGSYNWRNKLQKNSNIEIGFKKRYQTRYINQTRNTNLTNSEYMIPKNIKLNIRYWYNFTIYEIKNNIIYARDNHENSISINKNSFNITSHKTHCLSYQELCNRNIPSRKLKIYTNMLF
tara:strand:- start:1350 stop:2003 length:654 start_codon:yes stop_codon:yes gene_type:complete